MTAAYSVQRAEQRVPMALAVQIEGNESLPGVETTFTENVSARGARVTTIRRWRTNDRLHFATLPGEFRATARVAYCQPRRWNGFAIGLEFLEPTGHWVIQSPAVQEDHQRG